MTTAEMKTTYNDTEITYNEHESKFVFELRGRERKADTLSQAKEIIDKPQPKEKKPFERVKAYLRQNWGEQPFREIEVTSIAEGKPYSTTTYVWTLQGDRRSKEPADSCILKNDHNDRKIVAYRAREKEIEELESLNRQLLENMERLTVPE